MKHLSWSSPIWFGLLILAGLFVALALGITPWTRVRITEANFDKIQEGMSEREVEAILGGPPGNYSTPGSMVDLRPRDLPFDPDLVKFWIGDDIWIGIEADHAGQVIKKKSVQVYPGRLESRPARLWRKISGRFRQNPGVPP
jgi:hypothetical protein